MMRTRANAVLLVPRSWSLALMFVTCRDEKRQVEMLTLLKGEGLTCKAVVG